FLFVALQECMGSDVDRLIRRQCDRPLAMASLRQEVFILNPISSSLRNVAFAFLAACISAGVPAQPYPDKPITLVVVFAAGATADIVGRVVGAQLSKQLGQQVIIDNKPGAGGNIGD